VAPRASKSPPTFGRSAPAGRLKHNDVILRQSHGEAKVCEEPGVPLRCRAPLRKEGMGTIGRSAQESVRAAPSFNAQPNWSSFLASRERLPGWTGVRSCRRFRCFETSHHAMASARR
jgi:hypothetical protein